MTVHDLHDALTLLPSDLVTATDRLRSTPKSKAIPLRRWVSLAVCLVLVLSVTLVFGREILPGMGGGSKEAAAEAPAAAAPLESGKLPPTEAPAAAEPAAPQEAPAEDAASTMNGSSQTTDEQAAEEELCIEHSHSFADKRAEDRPAVGYCGNMITTIFVDGEEYTISGSDSVTITDILINLDYNPDQVCRCLTTVTVDTELLTGIQLNLQEGFARCEQGQAALTEEEAKTIQAIIDSLQ